jgi:hypothetical protein
LPKVGQGPADIRRTTFGTVVRLRQVTGVEMIAERSRQAHRAARVPQVGK